MEKFIRDGPLFPVAQSEGQLSSVSGPPQIPSPQQGEPGGTSSQFGRLPPPPPPVANSPFKHLEKNGKSSVTI